jgi:hypothetical protein
MTYKNEILVTPKRFANRMWKSSFLTSISILSSYYYGVYDCFIISIVVLLNSLNYWRHPIKGYRRNLDIFTAFFGLAYELYLSFLVELSDHLISYYLLTSISIFCYYKARTTIDRSKSSLWHCSLHLIANIANFNLYIALKN